MVREAKTLLAPIVIALILTFVLAPWVRALRQKGIPESLGAGIVVLALLSSTAPLGLSLASPAAEWLERAPTTVNQLLAQFDRLRASIPGFGSPPAPRTVYGLTASRSKKPAAPPADPVKERLASEGLALTSALVGRSLEFALAFAATVILLYFLLASEHWMLSRMMKA